jgi:hypothetical protein
MMQGLWLRRAAMVRLRTAINAAVMIQSIWRQHVAEKKLASLRHAALSLQAAYRGHAGFMRLARMRAAAGVIQRCARGMLARRQVAAQRAMEFAVNEFKTTMAVYANRCCKQRFLSHIVTSLIFRMCFPAICSVFPCRLPHSYAAHLSNVG